MAAPQNIDDLLVCLMSMGFDWSDCQDAVQYGKVTVETAVEWLLAGKPGFQKEQTTSQTPSLSLRPNTSKFDEGLNPFSQPTNLPGSSDQSTTDNDTTQNADQSKADSNLDDNQSETGILSRLHLSNEQRQIKQHFEKKQRDEAKHEAMKEKQRRKRDHDRILKEIAEDREKQKQIHGAATPQNVTESPIKSPTETSISPVKEESKPKTMSDKCLLRIRMLDGSSKKTSLPATSCLIDVWNFIQIPQNSEHRLIEPFPHREFGEEDLNKTLQELGLTPTGSLVLQKKETTQAVAEKSAKPLVLNQTDTQKLSVCASNNPFGGGANQNPGGMPPILPGMPPNMAGLPSGFGPGFGAGLAGGPGHLPGLNPNVSHDGENTEWGPGHRMDTSDNTSDNNVDPSANEGDNNISDDEDDDEMGQGLPGPPGGWFGGGGGGGAGWGGGNNMNEDNSWGVGQRLVPEGVPHDHDGQHHNRSARELAAEKARERFSRPAEPMKVEDSAPTAITYNVDNLLLLCMSHVAQRLNDPRHLLRSLSGISEDLAQKLLQHLLKQKLLKQKTLNAFIPCFLRKLFLDCYPYTTNELLHSVRLHTHLQMLSLKSCSLITDAGLQAITVLKKLKNLNLSGCKQLTDKCLPIVQELPSIVSLNLEDTGITEEGLILYLASCPQCLQHLNLSRTKVTEKIFQHLKCLPALKSLFMEQTQLCGLSGIQDLKQLETLDISHTDIVTDSLLCLRENKCLTCLSISHTEKVNGDQALEYLSCLKLQAINLPSRHTTTDTGMKYLAGFPLTVLDLTNFRKVGNIGMQFIGQIKMLKRLLLINTSITDEGMFYLEGLKQLEVLYLDKTNITDEGASVLKDDRSMYMCIEMLCMNSFANPMITCTEFTHLQELSLASTQVTSKFLMEGVLKNCYYLSKLNLSCTGVTTKGVRSLELGSLTLLNLECTAIKPFVLDLLRTNCPKLKNIVASNLIPVDATNDDEGMEF